MFRMLARLSLVALLLAVPATALAQRSVSLTVEGAYDFIGRVPAMEVSGVESPVQEDENVRAILDAMSVRPDFEVVTVSNNRAIAKLLPEGCGTAPGQPRCKPFLIYDPEFLRELDSRTGNRWAGLSVLAHEIGHHLSQHPLGMTGSRPNLELAADQWSGYAMCMMGAGLGDAQAALNAIASSSGSDSHPPKRARLQAVELGWNNARDQRGGRCVSGEVEVTISIGDRCGAGRVRFRLFHKSGHDGEVLRWWPNPDWYRRPGETTLRGTNNWYYPRNDGVAETHTQMVILQPGNLLCWGGGVEGLRGSYLGVGESGRRACDDCCVRVDNGVRLLDLGRRVYAC